MMIMHILLLSILVSKAVALEHDLMCGQESLVSIANLFGVSVDVLEIKEDSFWNEQSGTSMFGLLYASEKINLPAVPLHLDYEQLVDINAPFIAHVDNNHFIAITRCDKKYVNYIDNYGLSRILERDDFEKIWDGNVILYSKKIAHKYKKEIYTLLHPSGPKLFLPSSKYDFGTVVEGTNITFNLQVNNIGNEELVLKSRQGCSCISVAIKNPIVKPHESTEIQVTFKTNGYWGDQNREVHLISNDIETTISSFFVSGYVQNNITLNPTRLWIKDSETGKIVEKIIQFEHDSNVLFTINKIDSSSDIRTEYVEPFVEQNKTIVPIKIHFTIPDVPGQYQKYILFNVNQNKEYRVDIQGLAVDNYYTLPANIYFINDDISDKVVRLYKYKKNNMPKKLEAVTDLPLDLILTSIDMGQYELCIKYIDTFSSGTIDILDEGEKILSIPIYRFNGGKP